MKRTVLIIISLLMGLSARAQFVVSDPINQGINREQIVEGIVDRNLNSKSSSLLQITEEATKINTKEALALYSKIQSWISDGVNVTNILLSYKNMVSCMVDYTRLVSQLDPTDIPLMIHYVRQGWGYVVYAERQIKLIKSYLSKSNDMEIGARISGIQQIDKHLTRACSELERTLSQGNIIYSNSVALKRGMEEMDIFRRRN